MKETKGKENKNFRRNHNTIIVLQNLQPKRDQKQSFIQFEKYKKQRTNQIEFRVHYVDRVLKQLVLIFPPFFAKIQIARHMCCDTREVQLKFIEENLTQLLPGNSRLTNNKERLFIQK